MPTNDADDCPPSLTESESNYVVLLRAQMKRHGWIPSTAPDDWYAGMDVESADGRCLAWVDLSADNCVMLTVGAYYNGVVTTVGSLHSQLFDLQRDDPRVPPSTFGGTISEQVVRAANWFDKLVRRPILRSDWSATAQEYAFADDGTLLVISGSRLDRSGPPIRETVINT
ncbi:hypothetical protein EV648_104299 [Kribbella sp. VKM Ac-2568]|nr:hypothetical protein EV648_104299 [Kribbella sp. VKM Ac-2568]